MTYKAPKLAGDVTGAIDNNTVVALQKNPIQQRILGAADDGYILTWNNASSFWQASRETGGVPSATTGSLGVIQLGGDLGGVGTSATTPIVSGIQGNPVSSSPALAMQFLVENGGGTGSAWTTLSGDVSTTTPGVIDVISIHGASIPFAGSLITGNVLQVSGSSSLSYAPLNLGGGVNFISGTLPANHIPNLLGDVTGSITSNTVVKIQGNPISSTTPNDGYVLTWVALDGEWEPQPPTGSGSGSPTGPASGDLGGTYPSPSVININGASVPLAGSLTTGNILQVSGISSLTYAPLNLAGGTNFVVGNLPAGNQASQTMGGDVTGTTAASIVAKIKGNAVATQVLGSSQDGYVLTWSNTDNEWEAKSGGISLITLTGDVVGTGTGSIPTTVDAIQNNQIQSGILGVTQDGYVLTWRNASSQWQPQPTSSTIVDAQNYQFSNTNSDVSGYDQLLNSATGVEADLSVSVSSGGGKTLIKAFATGINDPQVNLIPAGLWEFNFYAYVDILGAFSTNLIFDVYTRTSGGAETLLFSATSTNLTFPSVGLNTLNFSNPVDTYISNTTRLVIKISAQTTSVSSVNTHFVFDGTTHASIVRTPIGGAAIQLGGDVTGTTSANTVSTISGSGGIVAFNATIAGNTGTSSPVHLSETIINMTDADYTLSSTDLKNPIITFTGTITARRNIFFPTTVGAIFIVSNKTIGGLDLMLHRADGADAGVTLPSGLNTTIYYNNNANSYQSFISTNHPGAPDTVAESTTSTGTGTITLNGASSSRFTAFSTAFPVATTQLSYCIFNTTGDWEIGLGTYTLSGTTLSRDQVISSSNGNNLVNLMSGTHTVILSAYIGISVIQRGMSMMFSAHAVPQ